jgi:hypothetical protein
MPTGRGHSLAVRRTAIKVETPQWEAANQYRAKLFEKPAN